MDFEKNILFVFIVLLIVLISALILFIDSEDVKAGFTELYFVNGLPKTIEMNKEYSFSFGVHNFEEKKMDYDYAIYSQSKQIGQGTVTLYPDEAIVISQGFTENRSGTIPISVKLLNKNQEIHFWTIIK